MQIEIPNWVSNRKLIEAFYKFAEDDYEWLNDNLKSFFNHGNPDWTWIKEYLQKQDSLNDAP